MNPLDLDFEPWKPGELRDFRKSLWVTGAELRLHPTYVKSYPSSTDMGNRVGVTGDQWRVWEREGVPCTGWSALLRIYRDEKRNVQPLNCSIAALDALAEIVGDFSALARALEVSRRTVTRWKYRIGYVPGINGYGRIVRICYEDICL